MVLRHRPLVSVVLLLSAGCVPAPSEDVPSRSESSEFAEKLLEAREPSRLDPGPASSSSLDGLAIPSWPSEWRVADRGRFASDGAPVVWYRLEAGDVEPEAAARDAARAVVGVAGRVRVDDVVTHADGLRAVAQVRGSRMTAVIEATRGERGTVVRALFEPKPGFGEPEDATR